jgi:hypothetical protein
LGWPMHWASTALGSSFLNINERPQGLNIDRFGAIALKNSS